MRLPVACGAAALLTLGSPALAQVPEPAAQPDEPAGPPAPVPAAAPAAPAPAPALGPPSPVALVESKGLTLPAIPGDTGHFEFGSYGRVQVASDLRGGTGVNSNIVSYGDRIDEDSYAELELRREDRFAPNVTSKVVATLGFFPPFFHFSGVEAQAIAIRNLYAQGTYGDLTLWVGSRMYRGDDIYLLDWWPLDNQNTVGGGAGYRFHEGTDETTVALHVGQSEVTAGCATSPGTPGAATNSSPPPACYQQETLPAPVPPVLLAQLGPQTEAVTVLDRPRTIETMKVTHLFGHSDPARKDGLKLIAYGELQEISAGVYTDTTVSPHVQTALPADWGWMAGAEVAYWTGHRDTFVQLFVRHAEGIAAYDPLATPLTFNNDRTTQGSTESLVALGGNWEEGPFGVLVGAYARAFRDGDPNPITSQKYDEGIVAVRPQLYLGERWGVAVEGAFEAKRFAVLDPQTDQPLSASEWRFGVIPYFSPSGRGSYRRPQLRVIYNLTAPNDAARELYPSTNVLSQRSVEQYFGLGAEWWFNSSSYP